MASGGTGHGQGEIAGEVRGRGGLRANPWLTVVILTAVYTSAFLDRSVMALLVDPIRGHLGLSDFQVSLLLGFAFVLFYLLANFPAGVLVDRLDRKKLILVSGVLWSLSTIACGLSSNFWQLLVARFALGASEAFISPAAFALIRDRIPEESRGRALSLFGMAPFLGSSLSMVMGGFLLRSAMAGRTADLPLVGGLEPWQFVLVAVGVAAIMPVILAGILRPDGARKAPGTSDETIRQGVSAAVRHMSRRLRAYLMLFGYASCGAAIMMGGNAWGPTLLTRTYGISLDNVGIVIGPIVLVCGLAGLVISGLAIDFLQKRGKSLNLFAALTMAATGLAYLGIAFSANVEHAFWWYGVMCIVGGANYPVAVNVLTRLTPSPVIGKVSAVYLLVQSMFGAGAGPTGIAILTQTVFSGTMALAWSVAVFIGIVSCLGALFALNMDARGEQ